MNIQRRLVFRRPVANHLIFRHSAAEESVKIRQNPSKYVFWRFRISTYVKYVKFRLLGWLFGNGLYIQVVRDLLKQLAQPSDIQNPSDPNPSDPDAELLCCFPYWDQILAAPPGPGMMPGPKPDSRRALSQSNHYHCLPHIANTIHH